jgi:hypothetical protein
MNNINKKMYYTVCEYTLHMLTFKNPCCDPNPDSFIHITYFGKNTSSMRNPDSNEHVDLDLDPGTQRFPIRIKKVQVLKCLLFFLKDWVWGLLS